ncbi:PREDICTED: uncharacterized protein LOC108778044 [Cyphomyrmex costatus]|uniref:Putative methyltransferase KIAA1456 n=1 Tax=Cyphomyrmex costatus TaxID=456900 RepID=A0A195CB39_9HYME|nr:PREDICTED: uncharacterized protein LOC108778044 [Cyphomyrmex costatus]XP_018400612.1 PREDICTED: uncharacterized protein LOC108778044 [Cyphomyrmex costatus]KYM97920.1 Putative methyltransferase KIAA1456 [Cyphomyrmex costatus]
MSESDGEHAARSVALEQAYVHEVYEQCAENTTQSKHWPRIYQFLQELEPGALVCDIGCGNGKYLSVNHSVFKIGVDRCKRFTDIAREKENEVLICDNLALPFREESFDAVLSIAVVHHFATTERRVHALKELARVLRIGGRLVISVWAMEQKHRKFESQDVLIPWPKSHCMSTASEGTKHSGVSDSNEKRDDDATQKYQSFSKRNSQRKCKSKSYWIDPIFSLSPSTSSLSSPNETCYSCFRRALQKLARSKRGGDGRAWFPGSWQSSTKSRRHYDPEDTTDVDELPIELRRVETTHTLTMTNKHSTDTLSIKSKSLGDILEIERLDLVRSRSSIPGFYSTSELILDERSVSSSSSGSKPRLVKQKSYVEEIGLENPEDTAIENLIKDLPNFSYQSLRKRNIPLKQSSMNEELMSAERLEEKERVRRNIMKQASLNEELICKWRTFEALKDSISPVSASRRFQLLKNELTSKLKRSTTNIEKVSSMSIKNGFVRMLQGWKSCENESASAATTEATKPKSTDNKVQPVTMVKRSIEGVERRLSREDGSDSSKDSSLQSDTSVDSEDSFASVIYVPKQDVTALPAPSSVNEVPSAPRPAALQLSTTPPSPRVKQPLDSGQSSRFKVIGVSPLLKQQSTVTNTNTHLGDAMKPSVPTVVAKETFDNTLQAPAAGGLRLIPEPDEESDTTSLIHAFNDVTKVVSREPVASEDDSRKARLNQIKELLIAKPGFATRARPSFPLVRRASTAASGRLETVTRILPRLLSLELFNPETDDLDSDSSGVSSPESIGSVISVTSDERYIARKEAEEKKNNVQTDESLSKSNGDDVSKRTKETESSIRDDESFSMITTASLEDSNTPLDPSHEDSSADLEDDTFLAETEIMRDISQDNLETDTICSTSRIFLENGKSISSQSMKLLKAAANVASSLEDAVEQAIQHNAQVEQLSQVAQRRNNNSIWSQSSVRTRAYLKQDCKSISEDLGDCADESSSDLIRDISRYCQNSSFDFLEVCQTSRTTSSSSSDVARNNLSAESDITACWDVCNQVPKETSWIVNEAYDGGGYNKFANVVQSKLTPKSSKSLCDDAILESEFDSKFPCNSKYEVELEAEPKTTFISKCDESFRVNHESEEKLKTEIDLVSRSNPEYSSNLVSDTKQSYINAESTLNLQSGARLKSTVNQEHYRSVNTSSLLHSNSDDTLDFVMVSKTGEFEEDAKTIGKWRSSHSRLSMDSNDVGDSLIENTGTSLSDGSQAESTARLFTGSTVSLISNPNVENIRRCSVERRRLQERGHSLDEMSSETKKREGCLVTASTNTLSNASSQESLPSDRGGGSITYHRYYHVFREGELDQLINKYVENLHIISSYYDHSCWCVVAEKVQVWTI